MHRRKVDHARREIRDARRADSAAAALGTLDHETEIFGFTKGQFSLIQLLEAILQQTGPASLAISTWTAAKNDGSAVLELLNSGRITDCRWLVDFSFQRRAPAIANEIRKVFGAEAIRVAATHAKFMTIGNAEWQVVIRTSMNLNHNPRFEDFTVGHDPELYGFLQGLLDEVWTKQKSTLATEAPGRILQHFQSRL